MKVLDFVPGIDWWRKPLNPADFNGDTGGSILKVGIELSPREASRVGGAIPQPIRIVPMYFFDAELPYELRNRLGSIHYDPRNVFGSKNSLTILVALLSAQDSFRVLWFNRQDSFYRHRRVL